MDLFLTALVFLIIGIALHPSYDFYEAYKKRQKQLADKEEALDYLLAAAGTSELDAVAIIDRLDQRNENPFNLIDLTKQA